MKISKSSVLLLVPAAFLCISALGQTASQEPKETKWASISSQGTSVRWDVAGQYSQLTLTVAAPDGRVFRKEFRTGAATEFALTDSLGERLPDGQYTYELRLTPVFSAAAIKALAAARGKDNDLENVRAARKRSAPAPVEAGGFSILNGTVSLGGVEEERAAPAAGKVSRNRTTTQAREPAFTRVNALAKYRMHHPLSPLPDDVIPDDLIVQGSACVGLDCVNGEVFGFDTIRLKENNDRIQFDDTSTSAGFPTNNWQIRANSSASGGASFLAFVDQGASGNSETGTIVFEVDAGAPANSL